MNIQLKPEQAAYAEEQVRAGRFASVDDVVAAALSRLQLDDEVLESELDEEDAAALREGIAQLDRGEGRPWEDVWEDLRREFRLK
jgi:putative addiction module CopG family antidote